MIDRSNVVALADFVPDERELWQQVFPTAGLVVQLLPDDVPGALRRIRELTPDIVVTRIGPARFGIDLLLAMRADAFALDIPVLVLTSYALPALQAEARTAGADEVILLPVLPDDLCALAWGLIRHGRSRKAGAATGPGRQV